MLTRATAILTSLCLTGSLSVAADPPAVPLRLTEPVGVARTNAPATGGVPVGTLHVKDVKELEVVDDAGTPVAAQISPMITSPNGELGWVLVDLLTDIKPRQTCAWSLRRAGGGPKPPAIAGGVLVRQSPDAVTLANGRMQVTLSATRFDLFDGVWVDRNGDGTFADDEQMLAANAREPKLFVRNEGVAYSTRDGQVTEVSLEDAGPIRTTVRIDGVLGPVPATQPAAPADKVPLKFTVRVTMWTGRDDVKVLYAIRNTNPTFERQERIEQATLSIPLNTGGAKPLHYLVGAGSVQMSQLTAGEKGAFKGSQWHHTVQLSQVGPPEAVTSKTHRQFYHLKDFADAGYRVRQFQPGSRTPVVDVGFNHGGWMDLAGESVGCQMWLRDFAHDTPKAMTATATGVLSVDLIPPYTGNRQPFYNAGGYWLGDRSYRTWELNLRFHSQPMATADDWTKWKESFGCYTPVTPATAAAADAIATSARHPLVLVTTPAAYSASDLFWGQMPTLEDEQAAAKALSRTKVGPVRPQPAGAAATEFLHYENFHYRAEWDEPGDAIYEFLRTGDWQFYKRATSFGRNYRDFGVSRTDRQPMGNRTVVQQPGSAGVVDRWGKFCGCHKFGTGVIDLWMITGDRSYLDAGLDFGYSMVFPSGSFGHRDWGRQMIAVVRTSQATGDPKLKAWLLANVRPGSPPENLRADGRALICGWHQGSWQAGLCSHAIWHNYQANRDAMSELECDDFEDGIIGIARNVARYWWLPETNGGPYYITWDDPARLDPNVKGDPARTVPGKVFASTGSPADTLSCIDMIVRGYLLTGDKQLLERARLFWDSVNGPDKDTQSARLQDFQGMGSASTWARQYIWELAHPRADQTPPAAVNDLAAEALGAGKVKLTWTAPADGKQAVARYQLKHAPCPIIPFEQFNYPDDHNKKWTWWSGYNVAGEPKPAAPGSAESMVVHAPAGRRYFCLIAKDAASNESALSNVVSADVK